jgi:acylphosphatase
VATHLYIVGTVQGVGYRASFEVQARALSLSGWVRNRVDGAVEAVVFGDPESVREIIAWAWRGPSSAQVRNVSITEVDNSSLVEGRFELLPTK